MKIRFPHANVAFRYVTPPNWLILPNFQVAIFDCSQGKEFVDSSVNLDFQFGQFGSIVSRGALDAVIWLNFQFCGWHCCGDITLSDDYNRTNRPLWMKVGKSLQLNSKQQQHRKLTISSIRFPFKWRWVSFLTRSALLSFLRTYMLLVPS